MTLSMRSIFPIIIALAVIAVVVQHFLHSKTLPETIVSGNGRIEATEINIATKTAGRIAEVLAKEGDFVKAGDILARMDIQSLLAQKAEAVARMGYAKSVLQTTQSLVLQRQSEYKAAQALVVQHQAELSAASKHLKRSKNLVGDGATPQQEVDDNQARVQGIQAAIIAAQAQVAAVQAGINAAKSQVVESKALLEASKATIARLQADINDSELKAPRDGRIQYRVSEPGEVLDAGGRVLNMVDLFDVYMTFFLPTTEAGKISIGSEIRLVLDAMPNYVIPAHASFVASVAQFTPKTVETENERLKLMFRVRARIAPELLKRYIEKVKIGLPGKAYVKLDEKSTWPAELAIKLPQ